MGELCRSLYATNNALKTYVDDISDNLSKMASGNFNVDFNANYVGDFTSIRTSVEGIASSIGSIIEGIGSASEQVTLGSQNVSETASSLAMGASDQTKTVDEMSVIADKFREQINDNSRNAQTAREHSVEVPPLKAATKT
ncbi:MAG: methyl-accepting chemotaxis protein [Oscillospiraceae bacterium]|nr:methyl-accepting chemotaxis protein [Oscillospiraceae bacterium]